MNPDVAFFLPSMQGGGAERVTLNLVNALVERRYRVDLVLAQATGPYLSALDNRVRVVPLGVQLGGGGFLRSVLPLNRYLRSIAPRRVVSIAHEANLVAALACALAGFRELYATEHIDLSTSLQGFGSTKRRLLAAATRWLYRRPRRIIAVSQGVADDLNRTFGVSPSRIRVIFNPVIPTVAMAGTGQQRHGVLAAGRMTPQKDFATLIDAFRLVRDEHDVTLTILGAGELMDDLKAQVGALGLDGSVRFPGFVDDPFTYYDQARVFVLSSIREGLPTVLLEALSRGMSVVSTDCPSGPREVLANGRFGQLVPVGDPRALARVIGDFLRNPPEPAPDLAGHLQKFTVSHAVAEYERVLKLGVPA